MDMKPAVQVAVKHMKAMLIEELELIAIPALEEAAKKSATPLDDLAVAALKGPLVDALKNYINKIQV